MTDLVFRLIRVALYFDITGRHEMAKLLTDAIEEIENARKGHIRGAADEGAKQNEHADQRAGARNRD